MRPTREVERLIRDLLADLQRARAEGPDAETDEDAGLTAAREIVEALGGTLEREPGPKRGTRVTIVVPLRRHG